MAHLILFSHTNKWGAQSCIYLLLKYSSPRLHACGLLINCWEVWCEAQHSHLDWMCTLHEERDFEPKDEDFLGIFNSWGQTVSRIFISMSNLVWHYCCCSAPWHTGFFGGAFPFSNTGLWRDVTILSRLYTAMRNRDLLGQNWSYWSDYWLRCWLSCLGWTLFDL